ncbi:MAG: glycosyltransferase family 4 protein [Ectothiorhodospiraceae bacterium]|jgi:glycosyltransferase involved in cell wall biosynthesis|nr:glycosyltransferase family 4 protein [Ectothiorhodospiraceae bacterium]
MHLVGLAPQDDCDAPVNVPPPSSRDRTLCLYVVNGGHAADHRLPLMATMRDRGFMVEAAVPSGSHAERRLTDEGYACHPIPLSRQGIYPAQELKSVHHLYRLYRRLRPSLVHHATIKPVLYGSIAARLAGVPNVVNAITGLGYIYTQDSRRARALRHVVNALYRQAFAHPHQVTVFQNEADRDMLLDLGLLKERDCVVIPGSGVDVERFHVSDEPSGTPVAILPARMLWDKGVGEFVAAARLLRQRGIVARLALVGMPDPGNPASIPQPRIDAWVEEGIVEYWGHRDDMPQVMRDAHVVCLPSYREGLPKVLLEAAASGRPVVTVDAPGCRNALMPDVSGLMVPPRDADALADALERLLTNAGLRRRMGEAGRRLAEQRFANVHIMQAMLDVYRTLGID